MAAREQRGAPRRAAAEDAPPAISKGGTQARADRIHKGLDALIDEIDDVLEENAQEFVKNYVQRGGE